MCKHDQAYRIENESAGGHGCPLCYSEARSAKYAAGVCPDCGRNLADDMRDLDPDALCDRCFEQWETWAQASVAHPYADPEDDQYEDSRDAAF